LSDGCSGLDLVTEVLAKVDDKVGVDVLNKVMVFGNLTGRVGARIDGEAIATTVAVEVITLDYGKITQL
jgi:hypothetical protein